MSGHKIPSMDPESVLLFKVDMMPQDPEAHSVFYAMVKLDWLMRMLSADLSCVAIHPDGNCGEAACALVTPIGMPATPNDLGQLTIEWCPDQNEVRRTIVNDFRAFVFSQEIHEYSETGEEPK